MKRTYFNRLTEGVADLFAVYKRVSDPVQGRQDRYSLPEQERIGTEYGEQLRWRLYGVYEDNGQEGDLLRRPGFQAMINDARAGKFAHIVVTEVDRFSRDPGVTYVALYLTKEVDVDVHFVLEPEINESDMGQLALMFNSIQAKKAHESLRDKTQRGIKARARSGKLLVGKHPRYGYVYADAKKTRYVLDERNDQDPYSGSADVMRRIFADIYHGKPVATLIRELEQEGVPCPSLRAQLRGWAYQDRPPLPNKWVATTIRDLLHWPGYYGQLSAYRMQTGWGKSHDTTTGELKHTHLIRRRSPDDPDLIPLPEGIVPPLVAKEVWDVVQERLHTNLQENRRRNRHPEATLLRGGVLICGYCGGVVYAMQHPEQGWVYKTFNRHKREMSCPNSGMAIQANLLDAAVWDQVKRMVRDTGRVHALYDQAQAGRMATYEAAKALLRAIEATIGDLQQRVETLRVRLERPGLEVDLVAVYENRLVEHKKALKKLTIERADAQQELAAMEAKGDDLKSYEEWVATVGPYLDELDYASKRNVMRSLGVKVLLWRNDVKPRHLALFNWQEVVRAESVGERNMYIWLWPDLIAPYLSEVDVPDGVDVRQLLEERLRPALQTAVRQQQAHERHNSGPLRIINRTA